jgi:hypothetical protein
MDYVMNRTDVESGLPDFSTQFTKAEKMYHIANKLPNGHKIYQPFPIQGPPKFTQIGIFVFDYTPSGNPEPYTYYENGAMFTSRINVYT